ncbi:rhodanese-like domain-containing protein [Accumulibacter sp.]|jgi:rhodanese-related sulfurtransferase|uniref:rhodanese-like domain-containing protein n=1 Tax=Accumulibacter sp. TaxID=2053492 RepID=UPI001ACF445F|nr:rhodanese-like domain-containing protein [Accumulibacter sp.]MBN8455715.1 rhodanese-like domain-containing protein [Accumulibacter sp.]
MFTKSILGLATIISLAAAPVFAADDKPDTPTSIKGARIITVDEAKGLLDKKAAAFVDTRNALNYGKGHLPGASIAAYKEKSEFKPDFDVTQDAFDLAKLPADKNAKVVIYSDGPKGWKSYKASVLSVNAGYKNVLWMRDGFAGWTAKSLPVEQ